MGAVTDPPLFPLAWGGVGRFFINPSKCLHVVISVTYGIGLISHSNQFTRTQCFQRFKLICKLMLFLCILVVCTKNNFIEHMERTGAGNKERPLSPPVKHMKQNEHMKQSPSCETTCSTDHCVSNWTDPVLWQDLPAVRASVWIKPSCDINHLPPS